MFSSSTVKLKLQKAFTLVEMLIIVLLVALLTSLAVFKTYRNIETGVIYSKIETANSLNKAIQTLYIKGFYFEPNFVQALTLNNTQEEHFNSIVTLLDALYEGNAELNVSFPNYEPPFTPDSYRSIRSNLLSDRYRANTKNTGHFELTGDSHSSLEVFYVKGIYDIN